VLQHFVTLDANRAQLILADRWKLWRKN